MRQPVGVDTQQVRKQSSVVEVDLGCLGQSLAQVVRPRGQRDHEEERLEEHDVALHRHLVHRQIASQVGRIERATGDVNLTVTVGLSNR